MTVNAITDTKKGRTGIAPTYLHTTQIAVYLFAGPKKMKSLGKARVLYQMASYITKQSKTKQRCVIGVGMCLYSKLVETKNKQCKTAIIFQCYHLHLSDFCSRPRLTQPYNHIIIIYPVVAKTK